MAQEEEVILIEDDNFFDCFSKSIKLNFIKI